MSDDNKAPGWSVRVLEFRAGPRWCMLDGDRLVCWVEHEPDARRIVEAINGQAKVDRLTDARHALAAVVLTVDKMLEELTDLVAIVGEP